MYKSKDVSFKCFKHFLLLKGGAVAEWSKALLKRVNKNENQKIPGSPPTWAPFFNIFFFFPHLLLSHLTDGPARIYFIDIFLPPYPAARIQTQVSNIWVLNSGLLYQLSYYDRGKVL